MRKIVWLGLEIRKLTIQDALCITAFAFLVFLSKTLTAQKTIAGIEITISMVIMILLVPSPFGLKFRSVYFSLIWLVISLIFLFDNLTSIVYGPLIVFFIYHVIRYIFWKSNSCEFIPMNVVRGLKMYRYRSKIEDRVGGTKDKQTMKILWWACMAIFAGCLVSLIGTKIH